MLLFLSKWMEFQWSWCIYIYFNVYFCVDEKKKADCVCVYTSVNYSLLRGRLTTWASMTHLNYVNVSSGKRPFGKAQWGQKSFFNFFFPLNGAYQCCVQMCVSQKAARALVETSWALLIFFSVRWWFWKVQYCKNMSSNKGDINSVWFCLLCLASDDFSSLHFVTFLT